MKRTKPQLPRPASTSVRCAIYTRKSTEEGLDQEFNSLDAQREAGEAYIKSQQHEGWTCLPGRYDDGGFTGGNMDRPALRRLLADIEAGKVDCVVVYKVDRLSRSLLDFARMMQSFEKHGVSFVSVTQQFNTASSMGRLVLNVLLSFAQFEREIISERTRDKIAATRRKGKWAGGHPILGYDVDPQGFKLAVNEFEAERVRAIFALYLQHRSLLQVVEELDRRGWVNKRWRTHKGVERGGRTFTRTSAYKLLTNVAYIGKVRYKSEVHDGEHPGIVEPDVWQRVQARLDRNGRTGGAMVRNRFGAILKGLLRCASCDCAMTPSHTTKGNRRYRYYLCSRAQKLGWATCPTKSVPAQQIEDLVVGQIRAIGRDRRLLQEVLAQVEAQSDARAAQFAGEQRALEKDLGTWHREIRTLSAQLKTGQDNSDRLRRLAELQERVASTEHELRMLNEQAGAAGVAAPDLDEIASALAKFDPVWETLTPREQGRILELLIERVDLDGKAGKVSITFRPAGIKSLADDSGSNHRRASA
jgi:site-specific DNA recombinase